MSGSAEPAYLEQIETERLDLGQHAVQPGLVQHAGQDRRGPRRSDAISGKADSNVAPRWPLIRITYAADAGPMHRSSSVTR